MTHDYFSPRDLHAVLMARKELPLAYGPDPTWERDARGKLRKLLGLDKLGKIDPRPTMRDLCAPHGVQVYEVRFAAEPGADAVGRLFVPTGMTRVPLMICLQGHSDGMHVSWGEGDPKWESDHLDIASQALREGYATLALEQRGLGMRSGEMQLEGLPGHTPWCHRASMVALLFGRTLIGERVHDVSMAITAVAALTKKHHLPIDTKKIGVMGNSGGGTTSVYAGALEPRISAVIASSCLCQFDASIVSFDHCMCNYIPHMREWFEMGDIAALIAPKPLVVVHGEQDESFPIDGTLKAVETVSRAYADRNASGKFATYIGPEGHHVYPEPMWRLFRKVTGW